MNYQDLWRSLLAWLEGDDVLGILTDVQRTAIVDRMRESESDAIIRAERLWIPPDASGTDAMTTAEFNALFRMMYEQAQGDGGDDVTD
jgi:hypothetical protein